MMKCFDCKNKFEEPLKNYFGHKTIYIYNACPFCKSKNIREAWR